MAVEDPNNIPDNTIGFDPVSGNEVPMGSLPEEVRDDINTMLSEGEIVVPADVVRYHGVQLFEDLRAQAKRGYETMQEDGRLGGQPMGDEPVMGADVDIELSMEDVETTADMGQPESAFLGKFFSGLREANKKAAQQSVRDRFKKAEERKSVDKIKKNAGKKKKKDKPKNNFEKLFGDRGGRNDDKPATPPSKKGGNLDLRFGGNPMERGARKFGPKEEKPKEAGKVEEAYKGENLRAEKGFGARFLEGLGYNEGGLEDGSNVYAQKGGFDMEDAMMGVGSGGGDGTQPLLEMREYMNDVGHRIFITFINGEPQMAIPEGYYPVTDEAAIVQQTQTQGGGGGGGGGSDTPTPEPFDYKELTMDELQEEVSNVVKPSITIIDRIGKAIHSKQLIKEIDRRLQNEGIPIYEKEYLQNLKYVTQNPDPSLLEQGIAKLTGQKIEDNRPNLTGPTYDMLPNEYGVIEAYTPEVQKANPNKTTISKPVADDDDDSTPGVYDPLPPADSGFAGMGMDPAEEFGGSQSRFQQSSPSSSSSSPSVTKTVIPSRRGTTKKDKDSQRRRDRQADNKNMAGQSTRRKTGLASSATRGLSSREKKGGAGLDSRFGISGLEKGGLASKKKKSK